MMKIKGLTSILDNRMVILSTNAVLGLLLLTAVFLFMREVVAVSFMSGKKIVEAGRPEPKPARHNLNDYAPILKHNPFGFPAGELRAISGQSAAISQMDVTLVGTVSGGRTPYAIFMDKTGHQEVFTQGNSVYELGILDKVEKDRVFIKTGDSSLEVQLVDIVSIRGDKKTSGTPASSGLAERLSESADTIDQKKIEQAIKNPKELMTDARLLPNIVDGRPEGFALHEVRPGGIYQSLGLQNGDVLLRVNEYNISNPEAGLQAFTALKGMDRVQLDIIRSGSKMTMTYQIK